MAWQGNFETKEIGEEVENIEAKEFAVHSGGGKVIPKKEYYIVTYFGGNNRK